MSYLPCKNPNCKSYGQPHPNCKCYGEMAEGGEVAFCSSARNHEHGCEYFQDGGDVGDVEVDPSQVAVDNSYDEEVPSDQVDISVPSDGDEVPQENVAVDGEPNEIPDDQVAVDGDKYSSFPQKVTAGIEGASEGALSFISPLVETKVLGISPADITGRAEANPEIHNIAKYGTMVGSALASEGVLPEAMKLAEMASKGSAALKGAIANGLFQAGDEASKWILGQQGEDHEQAFAASVMKTAAAGLFGLGMGAIGGKFGEAASDTLKSLAEKKVGYKMESFLAGLAFSSGASERSMGEGLVFSGQHAGENPLAAEYDKKAFDAGEKFLNESMKSVVSKVSGAVGAGMGGASSGVAGSLWGALKGLIIGNYAGKAISKSSEKYLAPAVLKILQSDKMAGIFDALNHAQNIEGGAQCLENGVEHVFNYGAVAGNAGLQKIFDTYEDEKKQKALDERIKNGGPNADIQQQIYQNNAVPSVQGFAEGGIVPSKDVVTPPLHQHNGVAIHFPEQNFLANVAKGRIYNYLSSLRPQENQPKLAFDDPPDTGAQKDKYAKALAIANAPLGVLKEVKAGTLEASHVQHLNAMYPEIHNLLNKKLTSKITDMQLKNEKPPHQIRQGLSLLMGVPLSSEFKPQNIMGAQAAFSQQSAQQPQQAPQKKRSSGTKNALSKSDQAYLTGEQALVKRSQRA